MNEKIQIFIGTFISFFSILCSLIFATFIGKKRQRTNSDVGARIEQARTTCESAKGTVEKLAGTTEQASRIEQDIERTNEQLTDSIKSSRQILAELKKRHAER